MKRHGVVQWSEREDELEGIWKKEDEKREERKDLVRVVGAKTAEDETRKESGLVESVASS